MEKKKNVRRNYIVDKSFQFKFVGVILLLQILVAILVGFGVAFFYFFVFDAGKVVCETNYSVFVQWAIIVAFASLALIIWGIAYTNRIIGPVHRIQNLLRAAASGNIPSGDIGFRKKDLFQGVEKDLAACFKTMERYRQGRMK